MDDISSIKQKLFCQQSHPENTQIMSSGLAFLKDEFKEKQKEKSFLNELKDKILNNQLEPAEESHYSIIFDDEENEHKSSTRYRIFEEILHTEKKFIDDLRLTIEVFDRSQMHNKMSDHNYCAIFEDLNSVISVAERFYSKVSDAMNTMGFDMLIGTIFLEYVNPFETVYKDYCLNYDRKLEILNKKPLSVDIENFINEGLQKMVEHGTTITSIDSMLVKPLQRFLKYPLFIKAIIQNTDSQHADIKDLKAASIEFERIALRINEKKRFEEMRSELFENSWHQKTIQAIKKGPQRLLTEKLYCSRESEDIVFNNDVLKFKNLRKSISFFIKTIFILRNNLKDTMSLMSGIVDGLALIIGIEVETDSDRYLTISRNGLSDYYKKYLIPLDKVVINPLTELSELFTGPKILIKSRKTSLLDYIAMKQRIENKEVTKMQFVRGEEVKNKYMAINNTLKEELPILISNSTTLFNECIANYYRLTNSIIQSIMVSLRSLIGNDSLSIEEEQTKFNDSIDELMLHLQRSLLTYKCQGNVFFIGITPPISQVTRTGTLGRSENYCQTDEDVTNLKLKFDKNNLAYVKKDFVPTKPHQIRISTGNIVGILKRFDPQGNKDHWLVEVSFKRNGFVPRTHLASVTVVDRRQSLSTTPTHGHAGIDLMQFSQNSPPYSTTYPFSSEFFQEIRTARFDFSPTDKASIAIKKHDRLILIEDCDKTGNKSWSLVKNHRSGEEGYVPSNYISNDNN